MKGEYLKKLWEIRKSKKECDWNNWKDDMHRQACYILGNCRGCGAFRRECEKMKKGDYHGKD